MLGVEDGQVLVDHHLERARALGAERARERRLLLRVQVVRRGEPSQVAALQERGGAHRVGGVEGKVPAQRRHLGFFVAAPAQRGERAHEPRGADQQRVRVEAQVKPPQLLLVRLQNARGGHRAPPAARAHRLHGVAQTVHLQKVQRDLPQPGHRKRRLRLLARAAQHGEHDVSLGGVFLCRKTRGNPRFRLGTLVRLRAEPREARRGFQHLRGDRFLGEALGGPRTRRAHARRDQRLDSLAPAALDDARGHERVERVERDVRDVQLAQREGRPAEFAHGFRQRREGHRLLLRFRQDAVGHRAADPPLRVLDLDHEGLTYVRSGDPHDHGFAAHGGGLRDVALGDHTAQARVQVGVARAPHQVAARRRARPGGPRVPLLLPAARAVPGRGRTRALRLCCAHRVPVPRLRDPRRERELELARRDGVLAGHGHGPTVFVEHLPHLPARLGLVRRAAVEHDAVASLQRHAAP